MNLIESHLREQWNWIKADWLWKTDYEIQCQDVQWEHTERIHLARLYHSNYNPASLSKIWDISVDLNKLWFELIFYLTDPGCFWWGSVVVRCYLDGLTTLAAWHGEDVQTSEYCLHREHSIHWLQVCNLYILKIRSGIVYGRRWKVG